MLGTGCWCSVVLVLDLICVLANVRTVLLSHMVSRVRFQWLAMFPCNLLLTRILFGSFPVFFFFFFVFTLFFFFLFLFFFVPGKRH